MTPNSNPNTSPVSTETLPGITARRAKLWTNGYRPVASHGKVPAGFAWQHRAGRNPPEAACTPATEDARDTGILAAGLRVIDLDFDEHPWATSLVDTAAETLGAAPCRFRENSHRCLLVYRAAEGEPRKRTAVCDEGKIEVLGAGQQFQAFGVHDSGAPLQWRGGSPETIPLDRLTIVTEKQIDAFLQMAEICIGTKETASPSSEDKSSRHGLIGVPEDIIAAMIVIPNDGPADWEAWNRVGMAVWAATDGSEDGRDLWHQWSGQNENYDPGVTDARWDEIAGSPPDKIGAGSLIYMAQQAVPGWQRPSVASTGGAEFGALPPLPVEDIVPLPVAPVEMTEIEAATLFAKHHGDNFKFDHDSGQWWNFAPSSGWQQDKKRAVRLAMRDHVAEMRKHVGPDRSLRAGSGGFEKNSLEAATAEVQIAMCSEDWNTDPWLLGTPEGYVDLKTGVQHPPRRDIFIKRRTPVAPAPVGTAAPIWTSFLNQAMNGDRDLIGWLQRFCGYCLTGDVSEEMFAFFHGPGGNGKGTVRDVLTWVIGADYTFAGARELFRANSMTDPETQLAQIDGKRLLMVSETEKKTKLAEALVKELSGNAGMVNGRHKYGHPFQFRSQAKLLLVGNDALEIEGRSPAMERRLHIVPFTFMPAVPDGTLKERLKEEYPAILRWMIDGCLVWHQQRLGTCRVIQEASAAYFDKQDPVVSWLQQRCNRGAGLTAPSSALLDSYNDFAFLNNHAVHNKDTLAAALRARGFTNRENITFADKKRANGWDGLALKAI